MFSKLAARNVRRSFKDYSIYFITLVFGVCVFYTFNALEGQSVLRYLSQSQHYIVEGILMLMDVFSVFVSVILAAVILYANTFMMKRRKKELGTYFLLGLPTGKVSALLFLETLLIGILALVVGVVVGVFFSFGLSALSGSLFRVSVDFLKLSFSFKAMGKTVLYFGIMFLLVMIFNGVSVAKCKLIDLIQAERRNEDMKEQSVGKSVVMFLLGVALIVIAYAMLLIRGIFAIDALFLVMLGLGTVGTLLFFRSLSGFVLRVCRGNKGFYYKGLNMFTLRQFNSKIHTTYLSMTAICLMLLLAIGITACSVGLNNTINAMTDEPFDFQIVNYDADKNAVDMAAALKEKGFDTDGELSECLQYTYYYPDEATEEKTGASAVISLSEYNAIMEMMGRPAVTLEDTEPFRDEGALGDVVRIGYVVMRDEQVAALSVRRQVLVGNYAGDIEETEALLMNALENGAVSNDGTFYCHTKLSTYLDLLGSKVLVIFLGLYLGFIFLLASAAVLALQQLSQAADNAKRYAILARLGAEEKLRDRSVFVQVALAFFVPLVLAIVHAIVGMTSANAVIAEVGKLDAAASGAVTAAFLVVIYGAYFIATCLGCKRVARGK
ncbi:MAG: FtsX-like permease family protein [Oscillospiraceae bacterium]|nr:FtsX-like permease family protein [Oscillospiraceae bacterium]